MVPVPRFFGRSQAGERSMRSLLNRYVRPALRSRWIVNSMIRQMFGLDPDADPGVFRRLEQEAAAVRPGSGGLLLLLRYPVRREARGCLVGFGR